MNLNNFLKTGALVAMLALGVVGCNENTTGTGDPSTVSNVSNLEANSLGSSSVGLRWTASTTTGASYLVSYRKVGATDSASSATVGSGVVVSGNSATITGLTTGEYKFFVYTMSGTDMSTGATINWAPAVRSTVEPGTSTTLRMYEFASTNGSGLILDPSKGGPRNASVAASSGDPLGSIALAILTTSTTSTEFSIGPAYAFLDFRNANKFDSSAYISDNAYPVNSLDELYLKSSLETFITNSGANAGNVRAFTLPVTSADGKGVAFLMRVNNGIPGVSNAHYARVLVKAVGGKLLQGTAGNRYVDVEVSYQTAAGVPYAKGVVRPESVPGYTSKVLFPVN